MLKSRVVALGQGERNFHIFYQLTKACTPQEKESLGIMDPQYFNYLNLSGEYDADGINDVEEYASMKKGMQVCNITGSKMTSVLEILAGILHLGNISFVEDKNEAKVADPASMSLIL